MTSPDAKPAKADTSATARKVIDDTVAELQGLASYASGYAWQDVIVKHLAAALQSSSSTEAELRAAHEQELAHYADYCIERENIGFAQGETIGRSDMQEVVVAALDRATAAEAERDALRASLMSVTGDLQEAADAVAKIVDGEAAAYLREKVAKARTALNHGKGEDARAALTKDQRGEHGE